MTIQQAIEKAIEGGYRNHSINQAYLLFDKYENIGAFLNGYGYVILHRKGEEPENGFFDVKADSFRIEEVFMNPLFWQSLGKAMGWGKKCFCQKIREMCHPRCEEEGYAEGWEIQWHRFIDHLSEGKDAESFFKNL